MAEAFAIRQELELASNLAKFNITKSIMMRRFQEPPYVTKGDKGFKNHPT